MLPMQKVLEQPRLILLHGGQISTLQIKHYFLSLHLLHTHRKQSKNASKFDIFNGNFPGENFARLGFEPLASKEGVPERGVKCEHFSVYTGSRIWVLSLHRLACYFYARLSGSICLKAPSAIRLTLRVQQRKR